MNDMDKQLRRLPSVDLELPTVICPSAKGVDP